MLSSFVEPLNILKQSRCETRTDPHALKSVLDWFDSFRELPISQEDWLQCQLALIEGFTNVVRHAHKGLPEETPIAIEVLATDHYLDINIWDCGPGFNFSATLDRKLQTTTPDSEGGRGLRIMHRIADSVEYSQAANQRNCLRIRKRLGEPLSDDLDALRG